ncbi:Transcriptional repressor MprA [Gemmata obscuriglobus]|nr:MarR family transcriptional regulator [Gemmata obscuriglobus]QEG31900.1 Transcriptional repressor MprA [Gemmata obscuriglobus]VTS11246.1 transcriptional : Putative Transcriptional regulator, MarR family OS=Candidatus Nitrospira defluvii GN=NIDE2963 PE=4 SV=1: MarR [Gemmata obscuriglobus UQM 2246]
MLARAFASFGPVYYKWLRACFAESGVSFPRMKLLGALHSSGPKIMSELGEELGVTARNVTALVDALEGEGLVRRVPHTTDRRATVIELTPAGAKYGLEMASGGHLDKVAELFRALSADEQEQLRRLVAKLESLLAGRGFGTGGLCGGDG